MTSTGENVKQQEFSYARNTVKITAATLELVISLLRENTRDRHADKHQETHTKMFTVMPFITAKPGNQANVLRRKMN